MLAETAGTERFDLKKTIIDPQVIALVPKDVAARHKVIPVEVVGGQLKLAMADIYNVLAVDQVRRHVPKNLNIIPVYCTDSEINELVDQYYDYEISIDGILKEIETGIRSNEQKVLDGTQDGYVNPMVRLVNALLIDAIKQGASDIHFEPYEKFYRIRYRLDGVLVEVAKPPLVIKDKIASRIKVISKLDISEKRVPQDGRMKLQLTLAYQEALANSLEHGNLALDSALRELFTEDGIDLYTIEKHKRLQDPSLGGKRVWVTGLYENGNLSITLKDEGKGFSAPPVLRARDIGPASCEQTHGRELTILLGIMDEVYFADNGREITLVKFLTGAPRS